jgi:hypothetical protein
VRRHPEADRGIDAGQLVDDEDVLDVAHAGTAVFLGDDDAEEAELSGLGEDLVRELLRLVHLLDDGIDGLGCEVAGRFAHRALLLVEAEVDAGFALVG